MRKAEKKKEGKVKTLVVGILFAILALYALTMLFVLGWGLLTSLKAYPDFRFGEGLKGLVGNVLGLPDKKYNDGNLIYYQNYTNIFTYIAENFKTKTSFYFAGNIVVHESQDNVFTLFLNSILYAGIGALLQAVVPAVVAYLCAKYKYKFSGFIYTLVLITMTIPVIGNQASMITLLRSIGLYDNFLGYFMMKFSFGGMYFLIYYAFFNAFSDSYKEAAEIDGAGNYQILLTIILPLSIKIIGTVFIIQFVHFWNDYQTALLYMPTKPTFAYAIYYFSVGTSTGEMSLPPAKTALCMMLAVPILIVFIIFKDKIMGSITIGGVKG